MFIALRFRMKLFWNTNTTSLVPFGLAPEVVLDRWRMHAKVLAGKMSLLVEEQLKYNFAPGAQHFSNYSTTLPPGLSISFHPTHGTACTQKSCVDFDATVIFIPAILLSKLELRLSLC